MSALTLDEIRAEAERLYGGPLHVSLKPLDTPCHFDLELLLYSADIGRSADITLNTSDLGLPLVEFTQRILEPCVAVLSGG